jgi:hypothetical protein
MVWFRRSKRRMSSTPFRVPDVNASALVRRPIARPRRSRVGREAAVEDVRGTADPLRGLECEVADVDVVLSIAVVRIQVRGFRLEATNRPSADSAQFRLSPSPFCPNVAMLTSRMTPWPRSR